jgi:hypothetical protein
MSTSDTPYRLGTRQILIYAVLFLGLCAALTFPATLIAMAWSFTFGRKAKRLENAVLAAGSTIALLFFGFGAIAEQVSYTLGLVGGGSKGWFPPVVSSLVLGFFYAGVAGSVTSTVLWGRIAARSSSMIRVFKNPFEHDSLVPTESEKAKVRLVQPPGGVIQGSPRQSVSVSQEVGKRSFPLGLDRKREPVLLTEQEIGMHGMILGSTGSGKTETIKVLAANLLDLGWPGMVLDLKEDTSTGGLRDFLSTYAQHHAMQFQELALSDPNPKYWFNPLEGMGPDEARDTVLSLSDFDDAYWKSINLKLLGQIVTLLYDAHAADSQQYPYPTILEIGRILSAPDLNAATRKMRGVVAARTGSVDDERYSALIHPTQDESKSASGFGAKLTQMYNTQVGRTVLRPDPTNAKPSLDVTLSGITYVGLDTQSKRDLSTVVSSAVLQRMSVFSGQRTRGEVGKGAARFIIIDEANAINRDIVKTILQKARAAGVVIVLCTQGPEDWIDEKGDDWSTMNQNINFAVIMAQGSPRAAELCAEFIGEKNKLQVSQQVDLMEYGSKSTLREAVDFLVPPHQLRGLSIGEAILRVNKPKEKVTWMTVKKRDASAR